MNNDSPNWITTQRELNEESSGDDIEDISLDNNTEEPVANVTAIQIEEDSRFNEETAQTVPGDDNNDEEFEDASFGPFLEE